MAMPFLRFIKDDGSNYPDWNNISLNQVFTEVKEKNRTNLPVLSVKQGYGTVLRDKSGINMVYSKANLKNYKAMKKDDFIIHLRSFEGGLECSNYDGISSPAYKILRCNNLILPSVYKYYFRSKSFISNKLSKAVIGIRDGKNIDMDIFWKISISVPCLEEQQKIADFLSDIDAQIEHYQQSLDNLEAQKKELLRQVFSQELRFKRDNGSDYPDWEKDKLENIVGNVSSGRTNKSNTGKVLLYGSTGIIGYCDNEDYPNCKLLIARVGANCGFVNYVDVSCGVTDNTLIINDTNKCHLKWLYYMLTVQKLNRYSKSNVKPLITGTLVKNLCLLFPCPEEQQKIADFFTDFDYRIALERQRLQTMQEVKKGLLQQMFC